MTYRGASNAEHIVPLSPETEERIDGFYTKLGWTVVSAEDGKLLTAVPDTEDRPVEGIGYWLTDDERLDWFETFDDPVEPPLFSDFTKGPRFPRVMNMIERPLVLPTDKDLVTVVKAGGTLLKAHTTVPARFHAGRHEIRFADPFLYGIRLVGPFHKEQEASADAYKVEQITSLEDYFVQEHLLDYREKYDPEISPEIARRAFGILVDPSDYQGGRGSSARALRAWVDPADLGLEVVSRQKAGFAPPASRMKTSEAVNVGTFLHFADNGMQTVTLYGLNERVRRFLMGFAEQLNMQITEATADHEARP